MNELDVRSTIRILLKMQIKPNLSIRPFLLIVLICIPSLRAELPEEAQRLIDMRKEAIEKIDKKFTDELEKIKITYTKRGDLDSANAILDLIRTVPLPIQFDTQFDGKWQFTAAKWSGIKELRDNGVCYLEGKAQGKWNQTDQHLIIQFDGGEIYTFALPIREGILSGVSSNGPKIQAKKIQPTR